MLATQFTLDTDYDSFTEEDGQQFAEQMATVLNVEPSQGIYAGLCAEAGNEAQGKQRISRRHIFVNMKRLGALCSVVVVPSAPCGSACVARICGLCCPTWP
jgi:hypothetical protein